MLIRQSLAKPIHLVVVPLFFFLGVFTSQYFTADTESALSCTRRGLLKIVIVGSFEISGFHLDIEDS